jgi:YegS/Rv2252/BmrU family lipid kinase
LKAADSCLIFNPSARGDKARRMQSHPGILAGQYVLLATNAPGHARQLAAQAVRNGFKTILAAGGDGTANEVLNGIADVPGGLASVRLGILPLGTVNVFAREIGLPLETRQALKILARGRERTIDLGRAEFVRDGARARRYFLQLAGAGVDSRAIELTEWNVKKKIGPFAYVLAGFKALRETRPVITVQAATACTGEWAGVGNGRYYGGPWPVFPNARLDDGMLDLCVIPKVTLARLAGGLAGMPVGRLHQFSGAVQISAASFALSSPARVLLQLDGENVGELPATLSAEAKALRVIVP